WSAESMPATYNLTDTGGNAATLAYCQSLGYSSCAFNKVQDPLALVGLDRSDPVCPPIRVSGSLVYVTASSPGLGDQSNNSLFRITYSDCPTVEHTYVFLHPSNPLFNSLLGFLSDTQNGSSLTNIVRNSTSVRGSQGDFFGALVQTSNLSQG